MREEENAERSLLKAISNCKTETEGWVNLADVGKNLRELGIQYGKLNKFVQRHSNIVEMKIDTTVFPPVTYAKSRF